MFSCLGLEIVGVLALCLGFGFGFPVMVGYRLLSRVVCWGLLCWADFWVVVLGASYELALLGCCTSC